MSLLCTNCIFFEIFQPRKDESAKTGCNHNDWTECVLDPKLPLCGAIGFSSRIV